MRAVAEPMDKPPGITPRRHSPIGLVSDEHDAGGQDRDQERQPGSPRSLVGNRRLLPRGKHAYGVHRRDAAARPGPLRGEASLVFPPSHRLGAVRELERRRPPAHAPADRLAFSASRRTNTEAMYGMVGLQRRRTQCRL